MTTTIKDEPNTDGMGQEGFFGHHLPHDTTLCNLNPFRSGYETIMKNENIPSIPEYLKLLYQFNQSHQRIYERFANKLSSPLGYFQYIGPENAAKLSHSAEDFIVDCQILAAGPFGFQTISCDPDKQIKRYLTAEYFSCYTVSFTSEMMHQFREQGLLVIGVEVILYLDNIPSAPDAFFMQRNSAAGIVTGTAIL